MEAVQLTVGLQGQAVQAVRTDPAAILDSQNFTKTRKWYHSTLCTTRIASLGCLMEHLDAHKPCSPHECSKMRKQFQQPEYGGSCHAAQSLTKKRPSQ
jgi:hypothetical protein